MTEQSRVWPAKLSVRRYDADGWSEPYPMSVDVDLDAAPISDRSITDADVAADIAEYAGLLPPPGLAPNRPLRHGAVQVLSVANPAWWRGWAA